MSDSIKLGPLPLEVADLYQHLAVFGQTGSGKTRYVLLPLLKEVLALHADDPGRRAGAIIFDVKGDMPDHVTRVLRAAGRTDELIVIGRGGNAWFDPFCRIESDSRRVAECLIEIVESASPSSGSGENEAFWRENLRRFIQVSAVLARAMGSGRMGGVTGLAAAMGRLAHLRTSSDDEVNSSSPDTKSLQEMLQRHSACGLIDPDQAAMAQSYFRFEAGELAGRTFATIVNYALSFVSCLRDSDLRAICEPGEDRPWQFVPEEIFDHGRVVLVSLSRVHFGPMATVFRGLIKAAFQEAALRRAATMRFDGTRCHPIDQHRSVVFVADEFGSLVTPGVGDSGDAFFLDKSREVKVACLLGMQGISALNSRFLHASRSRHLLNNAVTKVFLAIDCPETLAFFEQSVPRKTRRDGPVAWLALPRYETGALKGGHAFTTPVFESSDLRLLRTGEGIILRPRGYAERLQFTRMDNE